MLKIKKISIAFYLLFIGLITSCNDNSKKESLKISIFHSFQRSDSGDYETICLTNYYKFNGKKCKEVFLIPYNSNTKKIFFLNNIEDGYYSNTCDKIIDERITLGMVLIWNYKNKVYIEVNVKNINFKGTVLKQSTPSPSSAKSSK